MQSRKSELICQKCKMKNAESSIKIPTHVIWDLIDGSTMMMGIEKLTCLDCKEEFLNGLNELTDKMEKFAKSRGWR